MRSDVGSVTRKLNCWEYKKCGREPRGVNVDELGLCPSSTDERLDGMHGGVNAGRAFWVVSGTLRGGKAQCTFVEEFQSCKTCDFYLFVREEESPNLHLSALLLDKPFL